MRKKTASKKRTHRASKAYVFDFKTKTKSTYEAKNGLNQEVIQQISEQKNEPQWMRDVRSRSYQLFLKKSLPSWGGDLSTLDFDSLCYYLRPQGQRETAWKDVPKEIKETFEKLGVPEAERKFLAGTGAQFESEVVYHSLIESLQKKGVIFMATDEALQKHPVLFKKYFGTVVPPEDNKFAALNTAVWSGGTFLYVPKGVQVDLPLQAYFRINRQNMGQFERTLIIAEEGSSVHYVEGCFIAGSRVQTKNGEKPIELMKNGDEVMTHKGRYQKVYNTMKRSYQGKIFTINYFGDTFHNLNITEEHPLLVVKRKRSRDRNKIFQAEWMSASQVREKDYLAIPIPNRDSSKMKVMTATVSLGRGRHIPTIADVSFPIEPDFFRLLGYFYAEGHVDNEHYITFSFNSNEQEYIKDVALLSKKYFDKEVIRNRVRQNGQTLVVCSTRHARAWGKLFGSNVGNKHVPEYVFNAPLECLEGLIRGMWRGDGSYDAKKNMFRYSSVSFELAFRFRDILLCLGIPASINYQIRKEPRMPMYTVVISSPWNEQFGKIVGCRAKNGNKSGSPFYIDKNYLYVPIRSIKVKNSLLNVYNFSVENDESYVCEGVISHNCTAPTYTTDSLHSAVVEIIVKEGARVQYTTVQNWSKNVYNLVTKRAVAYKNAEMMWLDCNLGSKLTMKYPAIYLRGEGARGEIQSLALAGNGQHQDAGAKVIHCAPHTHSTIMARSISKDGGRSSYRGLVRVQRGAVGSTSRVVCNALILDGASISDTYPLTDVREKQSAIAHEASVAKISDDQLFYLASRGLSEDEAASAIVNGFASPIVKKLPMEYALELNRLLAMEVSSWKK